MEDKYFSAQEYQSLRNEMVSRINMISSHSSTAIITIISMWTAGITVQFLYSQIQFVDIETSIFTGMVSALLFLIPVIYFVPLAIKSGENLIQIASISIYIRVFYETIAIIYNHKEIYNWEITNNKVSNINVDRGTESKTLRWINSEYVILAISSYLLFFFASLLGVLKLYQSEVAETLRFILEIIYFFFAFLGLVSIVVIQKNASVKNTIMGTAKRFEKEYLERAREMGFFQNEDDYYKAKYMIDPNNREMRTRKEKNEQEN